MYKKRSRRVERVIDIVFFREVEVLCLRAFLYFNIFNWVQRSILQLGAQVGEIKRKREKDM
jgi:hypothetical protein